MNRLPLLPPLLLRILVVYMLGGAVLGFASVGAKDGVDNAGDAYGEGLPISQQADEARAQASSAEALLTDEAREQEVHRAEQRLLLADEVSYLEALEQAQSAFERELTMRKQTLAARQERVRTWPRRIRAWRRQERGEASFVPVFDELCGALRAAQSHLTEALRLLGSQTRTVPNAGPNRLLEIPSELDVLQARGLRERVISRTAQLEEEERALHAAQATQLLEEIELLNRERLALLPDLAASQQDALTAFGSVGFEQAALEARQLLLLVRSHRHATRAWFTTFGSAKEDLVHRKMHHLPLLLEGLLLLGLFVWGRRCTLRFLTKGVERMAESDRHAQLSLPSFTSRGLLFLRDVHPALSWLAFALMLSWCLPPTAQNLLEVQLVNVSVPWILGGKLGVDLLNAFVKNRWEGAMHEGSTSALRIRSIRLVGDVVMLFGLLSAWSTKLVGQGTIYRWVLRACWLASVAVGLVLVSWWRATVLQRAARARKKSFLEAWILAHQTGWSSVLATTVVALYLFVRGVFREAQQWIGGFEVTRRLLVYRFQRHLDKLSAEQPTTVTSPLSPAVFQALGPETSSTRWIETALDVQLTRLSRRLVEREGGVIALVGQRGMGQSTFLHRLHALHPHDTYRTQPPPEGADGWCARLAEELVGGPRHALLLDDVQHCVHPVRGGLLPLEALCALARRHDARAMWVFAFDSAIWPFLTQACRVPLFDETLVLSPWTEDQVIQLLQTRTAEVQLHPTFEGLLEKLPPNTDDLDKQELLAHRAGNYYRLLWDYAAGNPGVALHLWRESLGIDTRGTAHVQIFHPPDLSNLEQLPNAAVFVLRAVLQLAPATVDTLRQATRLCQDDIHHTLRYAVMRGYLWEDSTGYRVTWAWFRPLVLFLQRRHLWSPL